MSLKFQTKTFIMETLPCFWQRRTETGQSATCSVLCCGSLLLSCVVCVCAYGSLVFPSRCELPVICSALALWYFGCFEFFHPHEDNICLRSYSAKRIFWKKRRHFSGIFVSLNFFERHTRRERHHKRIMFAAIVIAFIFIFFLRSFFSNSNDSKKGNKKSGAGSSGYGPYKPKYTSRQKAMSLPTPDQAKAAGRTIPGCKFLLTAKKQLERDYILIIDRSASMNSQGRWRDAKEAVKVLAPHICKFDPDGITLIFFDDRVVKHDNVIGENQVNELFSKNPPRGSTDLAKALDCAFQDHFDGNLGATTILVVTDGQPNNREDVKDVICQAANALEVDEELSVSFIQIGNDRSAQQYLQELDDDLNEAKFDIVDAVSAQELQSISFNELIARSIYD